MGCNSTIGFGDLEDDKKYVDNENKPDNDIQMKIPKMKILKKTKMIIKMGKMPIIKMVTLTIKIIIIKMMPIIQKKMIKIMLLKMITRIPKMMIK